MILNSFFSSTKSEDYLNHSSSCPGENMGETMREFPFIMLM